MVKEGGKNDRAFGEVGVSSSVALLSSTTLTRDLVEQVRMSTWPSETYMTFSLIHPNISLKRLLVNVQLVFSTTKFSPYNLSTVAQCVVWKLQF